MKTRILLLAGMLLCGSICIANAQNIGYLKDISGKTVEFNTKTELVGDPYLTKDWSRATILSANGKTYQDIPIKYDQVENMLYFKDAEGNVNKFAEPVKSFILVDEGNKIYRPFGIGNAYFYHVIYDGATKLIYRDAKYIKESREYNSATTIKKVASADRYYFVKRNQAMEEVKLNKKSILAALADKQADLSKYMETANPNLNTTEGVRQLLEFYDKL